MRAICVSNLASALAAAVVFAATPCAAYTVYVSNEKGNSLTVIDSATLEVQATIPVGQRPRGIKMTKDEFESRGFTRLKQLEYLIKTSQIDNNFFWTKPAN